MADNEEDVKLKRLAPKSYGAMSDGHSDTEAHDKEDVASHTADEVSSCDEARGAARFYTHRRRRGKQKEIKWTTYEDSEEDSDLEDPKCIFQKKSSSMGELYTTKLSFEKGEDGVYRYVRKSAEPLPSVRDSSSRRRKEKLKEPFQPKLIETPPCYQGLCGFDARVDWEYSLPYLIILGSTCGLISAGIDYTIDYLQLGNYIHLSNFALL